MNYKIGRIRRKPCVTLTIHEHRSGVLPKFDGEEWKDEVLESFLLSGVEQVDFCAGASRFLIADGIRVLEVKLVRAKKSAKKGRKKVIYK